MPFTNIRKRTAANLTESLRTSAHTLVAVEVDYDGVNKVRRSSSVRLTYLPFVARAVVDALAEFPRLNASVVGDDLVVHGDVHLGIAVDLDFEGLVVPVIRNAHTMSLVELAAAATDVAQRAHAKRLTADDLAGGTFTITNAGGYGTLLTGPIINQPQVGIVSTDGVTMRPIAIATPEGDYGVAVHPMGNIAMSFDHRANDGAYAAAFLARVKDILQKRDWRAEVPAGDGVTAVQPAPAPTARARSAPATPAPPVEFPRDELIEDFRRACISRAIDDREINLQRQSRVFFQIAGAGHEALLLGLARHLRPGYDWFFPYYRDQALMLGLGISAYQILLQAVGSADDPSSGGRQMPSHWGSVEQQRRDAVEPDRQSVLAGRRMRGGGALHLPPAAPPGLLGVRRRGHLRLARRRSDVGGRVLGEPQHRVHPPPAGRVPRRRQRLRDLGAVERSVAGAGLRAGARLPGARHPPARRHRLLRGARAGRRRSSATCAPASAPR